MYAAFSMAFMKPLSKWIWKLRNADFQAEGCVDRDQEPKCRFNTCTFVLLQKKADKTYILRIECTNKPEMNQYNSWISMKGIDLKSGQLFTLYSNEAAWHWGIYFFNDFAWWI